MEKLLVDFTVQFLGLVMLGWGFGWKETDGPYMCPEPFRGQTAHPGHVHRVAETWTSRPKKMGNGQIFHHMIISDKMVHLI